MPRFCYAHRGFRRRTLPFRVFVINASTRIAESQQAFLEIGPGAMVNMAVPIQLSYRLEVAEGRPQFRVLGPAASGYTIDASRNLIDWLALYTNSQSEVAIDYLDTSPTNFDWRFYRVSPWP